MIFLNIITFLVLTCVTSGETLQLTYEQIENFVGESITFWNLSKPIIFYKQHDCVMLKLWRRLTDSNICPLMFAPFNIEIVQQVISIHHHPLRMVIIAEKTAIWDSFLQIMDLSLLKFKITVIFLCLDCDNVIFKYYETHDILGLIVFAYPDQDNSFVFYGGYYNYDVRSITMYPIGYWKESHGFQIDVWINHGRFCFRYATLNVLSSEVLPWLWNEYITSGSIDIISGSVNPSGFCGEVIKLLAKMNNFRLNVTHANYRYKYGDLEPNGTYSGLIGEFVEKNYDLAIGVFSRSIVREKFIDFTVPFTTDEMIFAVHLGTKLGSKSWTQTPFVIWITLSCIIVLSTCAIIISIERESASDPSTTWLPLTLAVWFQQGGAISPKFLSSRIIYITSCLIFWILFCFLNGFLVSLLSMDSSITKFTTLKDLAHSDYVIGLTEKASSQEFFKLSNDSKLKVLQKRAVIRPSVEAGAESVCNRRMYAHLGGLTTFYDLLHRSFKNCKYYFIKESVGRDQYHFITQNDNVLSNRLSQGILRLRSSGVMTRLERYFNTEQKSNIKATSANKNDDQVRVDQLFIPFVILAGGNALAIVTMFCELIIYNRREKGTKLNCGLRARH